MDDLLFDLKDMNVTQETASLISGEQNQEAREDAGNGSQNTDHIDTSVDIDEQGQIINTTVEDEENAGSAQTLKSSPEEDTPSSDGDSSQNSTLYALAKHLKEEGVLFIDEEIKDIKSLDDLKSLIKTSNEKARYANLNESQRRYQDALESGIPVKEYEKIEKEIQTFTGIKAEDVQSNENLRYEILAIDMMNQGIDKDRAMKLARLSLSDQNNVQDAQEALKNIIDFKKNKFTELSTEGKQNKEVQISDVKKSVYERETLLDNKLNDITKNKLFDLITNQVDADEQGNPLNELQKWQRENPLESSVLLNYMFLMTNKGKDLNLIKTAGSTQASKDLEKRLQGLSLNEDGSLDLPDSFLSGKSANEQRSQGSNANKNRNNYTINI